MQPPKKPAIPRTAQETVRHAIIELLRGQTFSALDISAEVHIPEKEVCGHLEHIRKSIHASGAALQVTPAECRKCGFVFTKRDRLSIPSRCPVCRHEAVLEPLFTIVGMGMAESGRMQMTKRSTDKGVQEGCHEA